MNYMKIKYPDVANGPGVRVSLFVSGCFQHCPGCFNPESWDLQAGKPYTDETEEELLSHLDKPEVAGLSILGGEPLLLSNLPAVNGLVVRTKMSYPDKPLWLWTGYTFEELETLRRRHYIQYGRAARQIYTILRKADVLVDGPYIEARRDLTLQFRGSTNQRIIDLQRTWHTGTVQLWEGRA